MRARIALIVPLALLTAACDVSMTTQPKYTTFAPSGIWSGGS